jgi:thiol-disulfide isomerase/thioredoxin
MNKKTLYLTLGLAVLLAVSLAAYRGLTKDSAVDFALPAASGSPSREPAPAQTPSGGSGQTQPDAKQSSSDGQEQKVLLPDAVVKDSNGADVHLSSFAGRPTVINFWASWCPPCQSEMPDFQKVYEKYSGRVNFVMINLTDQKRETIEKAEAFIEKNSYSFPVYFDTQSAAANAYKISSIPATYVADADGALYGYHVGVLDEKSLSGVLDKLLE